MSINGRRMHIVEEDEYIADINGSVGFATTQYSINPGQSGTFPWMSKIASLFERYVFEKLEFYYRREVSEFATNGQAGKVLLSVDYDASDAPPTTKQQVEDTVPHVDGMPCIEEMVVHCDPRELLGFAISGRYVRPGAQPFGTDIKTYDAGNLFVSTYGNTNTSVIGELRVRYRCRMLVPVLESGNSSSGQPGSQLLMTSVLGGETAAATTVAGLAFASSTNPVIIANNIGAVVASTGLITLPAGAYLVEAGATVTDSAVSPTRLDILLVQSTTLSNFYTNCPNLQEGSSGTSTYQVLTSSVYPYVFNTTVQASRVIGLATTVTYGSGTALVNGWLRITVL